MMHPDRIFSSAKRVTVLFLLAAFFSAFFAVPVLAEPEQISGVYTTEAILYIPDFQSAEFHEKRIRDVEVSTRSSLEKTLLTLLLEEIAENAEDSFSSLRDIDLLSPGFLQSRDTALIHLTGEVLTLDPLSRFTLCQAITNTVCGPGEIKSCLILADGHALSLDEAGLIPAGIFTPNEYADPLAAMSQLLLRHSESETASLHYRGNTALFYPTAAGHGIVCETKSLSYSSDSQSDAIKTILTALSETELFDIPDVPPLVDFLAEPLHLESYPETDGILVISFDKSLTEVLSERGILRSVFMASITMSLQGYFPWIHGVRCEIGGEPILAIVPVGLFDGANEAIAFDRGYMLWQDFSHFILTDIRLYFENDENTLSETSRYIPSDWANHPMRLIEQLFSGPSYYDSHDGLHNLYLGPETLNETLVSMKAENHELTLDFNLGFWLNHNNLRAEQNAVYAMVNTLTSLNWCWRVRLTVSGEPPIGMLSYDTPFMRSMDYR